MSSLSVSAYSASTALDSVDTESLKRSQSARDFESLLIGQMLHDVRDEDSGWLGSGDDQASDAAFGLGEEQLAQAVAKGGGLGLGKMIDAALEREQESRESREITEGGADGSF